MFDLTPGERRGALVVLALCLIGAAWDLAHPRPAAAPPPDAVPATAWPAADAAAAPASPAPPASTAPAPAPVDLNTADARALDALPGIGPVLAGRIVAQRAAHGPYRSADELLAVPGIGPRLLERLRPFVTASRAAPADGVRNATTPRR